MKIIGKAIEKLEKLGFKFDIFYEFRLSNPYKIMHFGNNQLWGKVSDECFDRPLSAELRQEERRYQERVKEVQQDYMYNAEPEIKMSRNQRKCMMRRTPFSRWDLTRDGISNVGFFNNAKNCVNATETFLKSKYFMDIYKTIQETFSEIRPALLHELNNRKKFTCQPCKSCYDHRSWSLSGTPYYCEPDPEILATQPNNAYYAWHGRFFDTLNIDRNQEIDLFVEGWYRFFGLNRMMASPLAEE